jgi:phytoene dehydrogenase-like protein
MWRQTSAAVTHPSSSESSGKRAVVVGGGWAGFGAALALAKAGAHVTLLDASANPGGLSSAFQTAGGQLVEPGIKGFWYQVGSFWCGFVFMLHFMESMNSVLSAKYSVCACFCKCCLQIAGGASNAFCKEVW